MFRRQNSQAGNQIRKRASSESIGNARNGSPTKSTFAFAKRTGDQNRTHKTTNTPLLKNTFGLEKSKEDQVPSLAVKSIRKEIWHANSSNLLAKSPLRSTNTALAGGVQELARMIGPTKDLRFTTIGLQWNREPVLNYCI